MFAIVYECTRENGIGGTFPLAFCRFSFAEEQHSKRETRRTLLFGDKTAFFMRDKMCKAAVIRS